MRRFDVAARLNPAYKAAMDVPDLSPEKPRAQTRGRFLVLGFIAVLILGSLFLIQKLTALSKLQDCVMSGRRNCAPIEVPIQ